MAKTLESTRTSNLNSCPCFCRDTANHENGIINWENGNCTANDGLQQTENEAVSGSGYQCHSQTSKEQALVKLNNQEQKGIFPSAPILHIPQLSAHAHISGSGNVININPTQCAVNQLKEYRPPEKRFGVESSQHAADQCEAALKSVYKTTGSFIQMIPWVDNDKRHIMDIYTRLVLETEGENPYFSRKSNDPGLTTYADVFKLKTKEGELVKLYVFNGLPGSGKSTLFDKIAYDWANGSVPATQGYKLVVLLKMFALEQNSDLVDAMFDNLLAHDVGFEKGSLKLYIENNPEKVLVLLDGFNKFTTTKPCESSFGSILKILNRKMFRGCCALVSTRPSHYDKLVSKQLVQNPFTHIRVLGFRAKNVRQYVHKFYSGEPGKAETLLAKIQSTNIPSELAESPMLLLLMCLLWRDDSKLPDTMSRLYSEAVEYIFRRKECVYEEDIANRCVYKIGKVGLKGLLSPKQTFSFEEKDFENDVLRLAFKVGILTGQKVLIKLDTHNNVQFIHKTFQEYCSGKYLNRLQKVDHAEFRKILYQIMSLRPDNFAFLLRFCCGDSEACTREVLQLLRERFPEMFNVGSKIGHLAAECYFEGQSAGLVDEEFMDCLIPAQLQLSPSKAFTCFLKCVAEQANDRGSCSLTKVKELGLNGLKSGELANLLTDLKGCMSAMANVERLDFTDSFMEVEDAEHITESLSVFPKLSSLRFHKVKVVGWSNLLKAMKNVHTLELFECDLTWGDVNCIAEAACNLPTLVQFEVVGSIGGIVGDLQPFFLKKWKHLKKLYLSNSNGALTQYKMEYLAKSLVHTNLTELKLTGHDKLNGSLGFLGQLSHLKKLSIVKCSIMFIGTAFSGLPNLEELDLSQNNLSDSAVLSLASGLQSLKQLQKINLSECNLIGQGMMIIAEALGSLSYVRELDLSKNKGLRSSAGLWSAHLRALKRLQKLNLSSCNLTEPDVECIAELLDDELPNLVEIDPSCN